MPALELAQETGKILKWLKAPGATVSKGEPIVEIETDKVTVEIEAPASGILREVTARAGDVVPVGQTIALIAVPGEAGAASSAAPAAPVTPAANAAVTGAVPAPPAAVKVSPLARKIAEEHGIDLAQVKAPGGKIEKADVLAHLERRTTASADGTTARLSPRRRRRDDWRPSAASTSAPSAARARAAPSWPVIFRRRARPRRACRGSRRPA